VADPDTGAEVEAPSSPEGQRSDGPAVADVMADYHRLLVDNTDSGLVLCNADGYIVSANPSAERLLGLTLSEMRGRSSIDPRWATVDENGDPLRADNEPVRRVLATGSPVRRVTLGVYRPTPDGDGNYVWLEIGCEPLYRSADDRPYAVVVSFKDVTQRRKTELELRESEARYRLLADNSSDVITRTSRRGIITWVSPSVRRLLGYSPQGLVGAPSAALIHPEDLPRAVRAFRSLIEDNGDVDVVETMRVRKRGGVYVDVEVAMRAVRSAAGSTLEIQSRARDVTSRVAAEAARRSAEDVFRLALEHAPIGMAVIGLDGSWITVNTALPRITGHSQADLTQIAMLDLVSADDRDGVAAAMSDMIAGRLQTAQSQVRMITAGGGHVWTEHSTTLIRDAAGLPSYFVLQVLDISDRIAAQEALALKASTDPLTGLPNRFVLDDRLEHALARCRRDRTQVGLVFIDLDHFKRLNDVFGHEAGDEVLRQVAFRLSMAIRDSDTAVRLGGDEFIVLCEENTGIEHLRALAERLFAELSRPYSLAWGETNVSSSLGLTLGGGPDAATLVHQADAAMYRSKQNGRAQISVFDEAANGGAFHDVALETELARALAADELRIYYQPVFRLVDGTVKTREALVRWQHPTRGLLEPSSFMAVAEQGPLISDLGEWMLTHACRDAALWPDRSAVAVNISPRHLAKPDFAHVVAGSLAAAGLPADRLQIEITETSVLEASTSTLSSTAEVTGLGVTLALDDFGTGYSSVTALQRLPITTLKLDKSFVDGVPDDADGCALVSGLLRMCAGLGLEVVAEGVETAAQADWLREHRCPLAQGFHFGRPEDHEQIMKTSPVPGPLDDGSSSPVTASGQ
jgi:diguanylate cyclase (GGDEF)-like protein/PAS domain S-box-containing protein